VFLKKIVKTRENFRIYVQISGPNSNFRTFQDKFQNFRKTPRPALRGSSPPVSALWASEG